MTDTMTSMNWTVIDKILVDTLETGDWIKVAGDIVEIIDIYDEDNTDNIVIVYQNDLDEEYEVSYKWDSHINVYMLVDSGE